MMLTTLLAVVAASASVAAAQVCTLWERPGAAATGPVWDGGQMLMAADPSVLKVGNDYHMWFTCYAEVLNTTFIGHAVAPAPEGPWAYQTPLSGGPGFWNSAFDGNASSWDVTLETVHVIPTPGGDPATDLTMFYAGYIANPQEFVSPYEVGLARSTDGGNSFVRVDNGDGGRVFTKAQCGCDAMTSPSVVYWNNQYWMIYLRWEFTPDRQSVTFLALDGATSPDGLTWTRTLPRGSVFPLPLANAPWVNNAVEPTLVGPLSDGLFYLAITADKAEEAVVAWGNSTILLLSGPSPHGPWTACAEPQMDNVVLPWEDVEVIAPTVIEDGGFLHVWAHGFTYSAPLTGERFSIGYARTPFNNGTTGAAATTTGGGSATTGAATPTTTADSSGTTAPSVASTAAAPSTTTNRSVAALAALLALLASAAW